jgi:hypothetical protein
VPGIKPLLLNFSLMRRATAVPCFLAFLTAFILAPFQHVHHDTHAPLIHAHLTPHHHDHVDVPGTREIESSDDEQASSLDTFTLVITPLHPPFAPTRAPAILTTLAEARFSTAVIDECGHDPPASRHSSPRPPPV